MLGSWAGAAAPEEDPTPMTDHMILADQYSATTEAVADAIRTSQEHGGVDVVIRTAKHFDAVCRELFDACDAANEEDPSTGNLYMGTDGDRWRVLVYNRA